MSTDSIWVGNAVDDRRLVAPRTLDTPWPLTPPRDLATWQARAVEIRERILAVTGLLPLPERTPLEARVFGRFQGDGYTVEKVHFQSLPGFYVCGNLYRPTDTDGPVPGIVSPHGHWSAGRLEDTVVGSIPGRGIGLARLGFVALTYDMVGYNDSCQIDHRRFGGAREDLWGIGQLGLQLWNSLRAVDFLSSLADVDATRIGATGASGGGTQTFLLTAVDDRVAAAAPVNMVSAHMQGGCVCENQAHLRLDVNNIDIAACCAPRPLMMVAATGDWTVHTPYHEYPAVRRIYQLFGAADRVHTHQENAGHNFNRPSREAVYGFLRRYLVGGTAGAVRERAFVAPDPEVLHVFSRTPSGRPRLPAGALTSKEVVEAIIHRRQRLTASLAPRNAAGLRRLRRDLGGALRQVLASRMPGAGEVAIEDRGRERCAAHGSALVYERLVLQHEGQRVPALMVGPTSARRTPVTLLVHDQGKRAWFDTEGRPRGLARELLAAGERLLAIDPFLIGEAGVTKVSGPYPQPEVTHFHTYNPTPAAARVQDVLTSLAYLRDRPDTTRIRLAGAGDAGLWCLLARSSSAARLVAATCIEVRGFHFDEDDDWVARCHVPGLRAAGDVVTALALAAPGRLLVHGAHPRGAFPTARARAVYRAAGASAALTVAARRCTAARQDRWLRT